MCDMPVCPYAPHPHLTPPQDRPTDRPTDPKGTPGARPKPEAPGHRHSETESPSPWAPGAPMYVGFMSIILMIS